MASVLNDPELEALLADLHRNSEGQDKAMSDHFEAQFKAGKDIALDAGETKSFLADKLVALDRDKAEFCYLTCRALQATSIVEAGTSYGVSTLYLAAALRDNARGGGKRGKVIATEYEPAKAKAARANFAAAGLSDFIDLREGDLRETLAKISGTVDFMLIDIWIAMARPALERVAGHLRPGAVVVCDNTTQYRHEYRDYFTFLEAPANGLRSTTLPFPGGLEYSVKCA